MKEIVCPFNPEQICPVSCDFFDKNKVTQNSLMVVLDSARPGVITEAIRKSQMTKALARLRTANNGMAELRAQERIFRLGHGLSAPEPLRCENS